MAKLTIDEEKLEELRDRMMKHDVDENDVAVVRVTAAELEELIDVYAMFLKMQRFWHEVNR